MPKWRVLSNAGIHVYGFAAAAVGVINLVWGDFATVWQPIQAFGDRVPHRRILAYVTAACLLLGGLAILRRGTAQAGALMVAIIDFIFAVFWLPRVVGFPQLFGTWGGFVEQLFPVTAGAVLYATLSRRDSASGPGTVQIARLLFGICILSFGIGHFAALPQTAGMVPKWLRPGQQFWAVATGTAFLLAGVAILSGVLNILASRLVTLMLIVFGALVWVPRLFAHPHDHTAWAGNAVNLTMIGTAWVFADWMARRNERVPGRPYAAAAAGIASHAAQAMF